MIAAPVMTQRIPMDLPGQARHALPQKTDGIDLRIAASGELFWNGEAVPVSALRNMMEAEVARDPANQPTLRIDAAGDADYGVIAKVLAAARNAGMERIGFVKQ